MGTHYNIDSDDLVVAAKAALFGPRDFRLDLLNTVLTLNGRSTIDSIDEVNVPEAGARATAITNLSTAATATA